MLTSHEIQLKLLKANDQRVYNNKALLKDHENLMKDNTLENDKNKLAAVLIPLIPNKNDYDVLFTKRSDKLRSHSGQISFPGGVIEKNDHNEVSGALREADEEVGIKPNCVNILGLLDSYITGTGFKIHPVVGLIDSAQNYEICKEEVDYIFHVPLSFLINKNNHNKVNKIINGTERSFYVLEYNDYYIWGVTAGIIINLSEALN